MPRTVSDHVSDPRHAGPLDGASVAGSAAGGNRRLVQIGLWLDGRGRVVRARYRATSCASLIAFAEAACALLEGGGDPVRLDADALRGAVAGVHPSHLDRANLVLAAVRRAAAPPSTTTGASP